MSKKRSPGDGGGRLARPRSGSIDWPGSGRNSSIARTLAPALELDACLLAHPHEGAGARSLERRVQRQRQLTECLQGVDATFLEGASLPRRDAGDEAQVIVGPPALHAFGRPAADIAMLDWLRVRRGRGVRRRRLVGHRRQESALGAAVVGHVVVDPQSLDGPGAAAESDVEPFRPDALDPLQLVDVRADLEDGARLDVAGELRVGHLVVVRPPDRRPCLVVDTQQEVGVAAPRPVEERRLVDDVGARGHRVDRLGGGGTELVAAILDGAIELDRDGLATGGGEVGEIALFVLEPALADDVELGVVAHGAPHEAGERRALELGQVLAGEVRDEVGGGVDRSPIDRLHASSVARGRVSLPVTGTLGCRGEPAAP